MAGCKAAAAGGVTSLLAMPNTKPPVDSPALLKGTAAKAEIPPLLPGIFLRLYYPGIEGEAPAPFAELKGGSHRLNGRRQAGGKLLLMAEAMEEAARLDMPVVSLRRFVPFQRRPDEAKGRFPKSSIFQGAGGK